MKNPNKCVYKSRQRQAPGRSDETNTACTSLKTASNVQIVSRLL